MKRKHADVERSSRTPSRSPRSSPKSSPKSGSSTKSVRFAEDMEISPDVYPKPIADINRLPSHLMTKIFMKLDSVNQVRLRRVCRHWNDMLRSSALASTALIDLSQIAQNWRFRNSCPKPHNFFKHFGAFFIKPSTTRLVVCDSTSPKIEHFGEVHRGTGAEKERFWTSLWRDINFPINHMTVLLDGIFVEWEVLLRCLELQPVRRITLRDVYVLKVPSSGNELGAPCIPLQVDMAVVEFPRMKGDSEDDECRNINRAMVSMIEKSIKALEDKELEQLNTAISVTWNESDRKIITSIIKAREGIDVTPETQARDLKVITQRELLPFVYRLWPHLKPKIKEPCLFIKGYRR